MGLSLPYDWVKTIAEWIAKLGLSEREQKYFFVLIIPEIEPLIKNAPIAWYYRPVILIKTLGTMVKLGWAFVWKEGVDFIPSWVYSTSVL